MKTTYTSQNRSPAFALLLVMVMCAISLVIMASVMYRTATVSKLNDRNNQYTLCCTVAGAATEKVFAEMAYDFQAASIAIVTNKYAAGVYAANIPTAAENPYWGNFVFSDAQGNMNKTYIVYLTNYAGALPSQYTNLFTKSSSIYRIVSNVSPVGRPDIIGTSQCDILFALLPIDTYAIFYNGPLEFTWCATMAVNGRTHANDIICVGTSASLTFNGQVTCTGTVGSPTRDGSTPTSNENTTFKSGYTTNVASVTLGITMTNSHAILEIPPPTEDVNSAQGQVRSYNQAQVLLLITNLVMTGKPIATRVTFLLQQSSYGALPGADLSKTTNTYYWTNYLWSNTVSRLMVTNAIFTNYTAAWATMPQALTNWLSLTNTFTDKREYQTNMYVTQINVNSYSNWLSTNGFNTTKFVSTPACILYVADQRNVGTNKIAVVRLVNGAALPGNYVSGSPLGWSLATMNPLYVQGNYNVTRDFSHYAYAPYSTTNSPSCTVPAALLSDAITILSSGFSDASSAGAAHVVSGTNTVNAAIVTGNVPTTGTTAVTFSGGVHNLMRMLEDWSSAYMVLNTSIVCLWSSQMATNQFRNPYNYSPAPINPYYSPPTRLWGFDLNFADPAHQPQGVPTALVPIRFNWNAPPPNSVTNNLNTPW